ncbi:MAG: 3-octaprenyl-4-hydroxybenzoate carboxy-lyase [Deltaproteobacteria bacterium RBG_16_47_11]|nr:MAG: 3-octaprenyl-4-hydroxybenzoate carboxy-lyase [Deltaproteobacteria bacterium RBG_16_47_11]
MKSMVVGITGASGVIYGVRILEVLAKLGIETHLIITQAGLKNLEIETTYNKAELKSIASHFYDEEDLSASLASGSFKVDGMVVAPCSIKTLSAIANSYSNNLLVRAADVMLKERRRLVLLVRETPLHEGHLELMIKVTRMGGIVMPPVPAFYHHPKTIDDLLNQTIGKVLDLFSIDAKLFRRWGTEAE